MPDSFPHSLPVSGNLMQQVFQAFLFDWRVPVDAMDVPACWSGRMVGLFSSVVIIISRVPGWDDLSREWQMSLHQHRHPPMIHAPGASDAVVIMDRNASI